MTVCTTCGSGFTASKRNGRPRTRCDACRSNHDRINGSKWQKLRRQVLDEEPYCAVPDCGRPSSDADHIIPLSARPDLGHVRSNLQGMCRRHNREKSNRLDFPRGSGPRGLFTQDLPARDRPQAWTDFFG